MAEKSCSRSMALSYGKPNTRCPNISLTTSLRAPVSLHVPVLVILEGQKGTNHDTVYSGTSGSSSTSDARVRRSTGPRTPSNPTRTCVESLVVSPRPRPSVTSMPYCLIALLPYCHPARSDSDGSGSGAPNEHNLRHETNSLWFLDNFSLAGRSMSAGIQFSSYSDTITIKTFMKAGLQDNFPAAHRDGPMSLADSSYPRNCAEMSRLRCK